MPRKTKEQNELENIKKETKKVPAKKDTTKKVASKATKKATKKSTTTSRTTKASKKVASNKKSTSKKDANTKKTINKKATTKKVAKKVVKKNIDIVEYYDLPYRYNQTVVKVLAQTPTNLFIYWDISDADKKIFEEQYGENFFETTKPILKIYNNTLNYNFEVEINDFANSWYLHVADSKCDYKIELGRRPIIKTEKLNVDYVYISTSNEIESPNDKVLFNKSQKMVYFRNVQTGNETSKPITSFSFIQNMGKIYDIYDIYELYKELYNDENIEEIYDLSNPSSGNPSSRKSFIKIKIK